MTSLGSWEAALAMMAALTSHGRPLFGRPTREIVLNPLTVAEVGDLLGLAPAEAIDAALVVGGFPLVAQSWPHGLDRQEFRPRRTVDMLLSKRIADPYLRFWLRFVEPGLDEIERGRADHAALLRSRDQVPGTDSDTVLLAVSRTGVQIPWVDIALGPTDLVDTLR